jgi:hypothetical protein
MEKKPIVIDLSKTQPEDMKQAIEDAIDQLLEVLPNPPGASRKEYMGDSVYADLSNGMIELTTENGFGPSNTIYLEKPVAQNVVHFMKKHGVV